MSLKFRSRATGVGGEMFNASGTEDRLSLPPDDEGEDNEQVEPPDSIDTQPEDPRLPGRESPDEID